MVAPIVPGLNDHEMAAVLKAAREAGAIDARSLLLRLPLTVEPVFREWLERTQPLKADKVQSLIRQTRGGKLNDSAWGRRMVGQGPLAEQIAAMFALFRQKLGFAPLPPLDFEQFQPPTPRTGQLRLC